MRDIDSVLRRALTARAETYRPRDIAEAERVFVRKRGRRRAFRAGGATVLAAASAVAVFALVQPDVVSDRQQRPQPAGLQVTSRFEVLAEPLAVAGGPSGIWVASREGDGVARVDPGSGEVKAIQLEGASEIAAGETYAWAGGSDGQMVRIHESTLARTTHSQSETNVPIVDMAVGGHERGAAWAVDAAGCVVDLTTPRSRRGCVQPPDFHATDVATAPNETWLLNGETGDLNQFHAGPGVNDERSVVDAAAPIPTAPSGRYADMILTTVGNDALWVSGQGGRLMRLDLVTGDKVMTQLDGDYADLAEGYNAVWALVGREGSDRGELVAIDVATGQPIGNPYSLSGKPSDVYAGADGVWVTLRDANELVRISRPAS